MATLRSMGGYEDSGREAYGPPLESRVSPHLAAMAIGMQRRAEVLEARTQAAVAQFGDDWQPTFAAPDAQPPALFRVGQVDIAHKAVPVLMGGLGAGHIALPADARSLQIVHNTIIRTAASVDSERLDIRAWVPHGEYRDFNELGVARLQHIPQNSLEAEISRLAGLRRESMNGQRTGMGKRGNPWNILLIDDNGLRLSERAREQLDYLASSTEWGMLLMRGVDAPSGTSKLVQRDTPDSQRLPCIVDSPPRAQMQRMIRQVAVMDGASQESSFFNAAEIHEGPLGVQSTASGIQLVLGPDVRNGQHPIIELGDGMPHVIIAATTGAGKSVLLAQLLRSTAKYNPDDLDVYYIDAAGPDAGIFGSGPGDTETLASLKLLATSVNDPEFVADALGSIEKIVLEREALLTRMGYRSITELREAKPNFPLPRILLLADEVARLLTDEKAAASLLNILGTGRKVGIHVAMATLEVSGAAGRAIDKALPFFGGRIALSGGQWLMTRGNRHDEYTTPISTKGYAWMNDNLGDGPADRNVVVRVPFVQPDDVRRTKRELAEATTGRSRKKPLVTFNGGERPRLETATSYRWLAPDSGEPVSAFVGQRLTIEKGAATADFDDRHGNNLLIVGTDDAATSKAVEVAARSVARQHQPGSAKLSIIYLSNKQASFARSLAGTLRLDKHDVGVFDAHDVEAFMTKTAGELEGQSPTRKHYVFVCDGDRMNQATGNAFKELADGGPERGVHITAVTSGLLQLERTWERDYRVGGPLQLFEHRLVLDAPRSEQRELLGDSEWSASTRPGRAAFSQERGQREVVVLYD